MGTGKGRGSEETGRGTADWVGIDFEDGRLFEELVGFCWRGRRLAEGLLMFISSCLSNIWLLTLLGSSP